MIPGPVQYARNNVDTRGEDWSGVSVHIRARVRDLSAGSGLVFEDRGNHQLKGVPEEWQIFRVT